MDPMNPDPNSFSGSMWSRCLDIAHLSLTSEFIQGIGNGDLDPNVYGSYMVQDSAYCYNAEKMYKQLSDRGVEEGYPEVAKFAKARFESYSSYNDTGFRKKWHIPPEVAGGLELGDAAQSYIDFMQDVARTLSPIYGLVMMIPCRRLWAYLARKLNGNATEGNLYSFWIKENDSFRGAERLDNFVNEWKENHPDDFDEELAFLIYKTAMVCELNFFRSVIGDLPPLPLPYYQARDHSDVGQIASDVASAAL